MNGLTRALMSLGLVAGVSACTNPSEMFTGVWRATESVDTTYLKGRPELAIGHFGPELTGVAYFQTEAGVAPSDRCPCAFIDHRSVDLTAERFTASTTLGPGADCDGSVWLWDLTRVVRGDDTFLEGTVTPDGTAVALRIPMLKLDATFVRDDQKVCLPSP